MQKLIIIATLLLASLCTSASLYQPADSLHISIDRKTKSVLPGQYAEAQGYSLLADLREIFRSRNLSLNDSTWLHIRSMLNSPNPKDTLLHLNLDGRPIRIAFTKAQLAQWNQTADSTNNNWPAQDRRQTTNGDNVHIGRDGIHVKDGNDEVHISRRGVQVIENGEEEVNIGFGKRWNDDDSTYHQRKSRKWNDYHSFGNLNGFNFYLGINTLDTRADQVYDLDSYALRPFGSRYVSMGWIRSADLTKGANTRLKFALGLNFSWYNFMLENNNVWTKTPTRIELLPAANSLKKSKLTSSYIEVPFIPYLSFKNSKMFDYIGVGGYLSYRLSSHTKTKTSSRGKKDHEYGNFYLTDFRQGMTVQLGLHNFPDLFLNYDFNNLFRPAKGPEVRAISFGIRL
jgi:hypothetical protein